MKFFIATDHAGVLIKDDVKKMLEDMGHEVTDLGCDSTDRVNYTDYAHKLSNEILARKVGFDNYTQVESPDPDNPPSASSGWYMFGNETNWVNHGFLLHTNVENYPEAEGHLNVEFLQKAQKAAREQINNFFTQSQ